LASGGLPVQRYLPRSFLGQRVGRRGCLQRIGHSTLLGATGGSLEFLVVDQTSQAKLFSASRELWVDRQEELLNRIMTIEIKVEMVCCSFCPEIFSK
jgi:hypothetical protein